MIFIICLILLVLTLLFFAILVDQQVNLFFWILGWIIRIHDILTLFIYVIIDKPLKKFNPIVQAKKFTESNYTYWQNTTKHSTPDHYLTLDSSIDKLNHLTELLSIVKEHEDLKILGKRRTVHKVDEDCKEKIELGDYEWSTYGEVLDQINKLANILYHKFGLRKDDRLAIMTDTSPEYLITFFAAQTLGCQLVALHSISDDKTILSILNSTKAKILLTKKPLLKKLDEIHQNIQIVPKLILFNDPFDTINDDTKFESFEFDALLKESNISSNLDLTQSKFSENDTALILFTSGSNGKPKAVKLSHCNLINSLKVYVRKIPFSLNMNNDDVVLAYLPQSHIFEMLCQLVFFTAGCKIAYSRPETLLSDLQASKASFWAGVPTIFEKFKNQIQAGSRSYLEDEIYKFMFDYKNKWTSRGFKCRLTDSIFFEPIQKSFGGNLKYMMAGGAPLSLDTQIFFKQCLNVKMLIAYASSECSICALSIFDNSFHSNTIGLQNDVKLRLANWAGDYSIDDIPNPRGEIIIGSKSVSEGYFEDKEEDRKSFFEENGIRWWRSGDIGEIDKEGQLSIIDRKSDLIKLQMGKYISFSKIESILKNSTYVDNLVIHINSYKNNVIAIVQPDFNNLFKLARSLGIEQNLEDLCENRKLVNLVLRDLSQYGKENGLSSKEIPILIILCPEKWTTANGLLSASLKTIRSKIYIQYEDRIRTLYSENWEKFQQNF